VVNPFDFVGAGNLLRHALPAGRRMAALRARARRSGTPIVYVNDNFGDWHCGLAELVERCLRSEAAHGFLARLRPEREDYYVLKPRHSGFLSTSLDPLLERLGVGRVVLAGVAAHICVLFTAIDAYMRGFEVAVASDCVASERVRDCSHALDLMARVLKAQVAPGHAIRFSRAPESGGRHESCSSTRSQEDSPMARTSSRRYGRKASQKVERAVHEMKRGRLRSGGSGKKVTSRKQAVAIGLSQARREGGKLPSRRRARKAS
jgi:nicotinamidase-related amidase